MFQRIFIEEHLQHHPRAKLITSKFPNLSIKYIEKIDDIFGKVRKPYLQKRENLNIFIGEKRGPLVKIAPDAYGLEGDPHFYFIHAYNCIYECDYCYLQGYFSSPDLVLFINHEDICNEIRSIAHANIIQQKTPWFHAGEYSDSLALSHLTDELNLYHKLFESIPQAKLELRTKSVNIKNLLELKPLPNFITSFSMAPDIQVKLHDLKTPPLKTRLKAMQKLSQHGHAIAIHFDPIIYRNNCIAEYSELLNQIEQHLPLSSIQYISLGVVRFTKKVFNSVTQNYPESPLLGAPFIESFDNKRRYSRPMRLWLMQKIKDLCMAHGVSEQKIYLCMESIDSAPEAPL